MSTHNISFYEILRKIIPELSPNTRPLNMSSGVTCCFRIYQSKNLCRNFGSHAKTFAKSSRADISMGISNECIS